MQNKPFPWITVVLYMLPSSPLLVTLSIDEASFRFFTALRQKYFPAEKNFLSAHLTLFHHLPCGEEAKIKQDLKRWSTGRPPLPLEVAEVKSIGKGVAYKINSAELPGLHRSMQAVWRPWLKPQDKQQLWPHVTVQNKVTVETAKQTLAQLQKEFTPFTATGAGLELWSYEGGPWEFIELFPFS